MSRIDSVVHDFLDTLSDSLGYPRDELSMIAELRSGGPTVDPDHRKPKVIRAVEIKKGNDVPNAHYDALDSNHIDYQVVRSKDKFTNKLASFQLHPLPGNCRICITRWVRITDDESKWSEWLQKEFLKLRCGIAHQYSYFYMLVTRGESYSSAELYDEFEEIYSGRTGGVPTSILILKLRDLL